MSNAAERTRYVTEQCSGIMKEVKSRSVQFNRSFVSHSLRPHGLHMPGLPVHHQLLEFTQTHVHWVSDNIQSSHRLLFPSPPTFNLSQHSIRVFSNESTLCMRWPNHWSFSFSTSPSKHLGLISFRMDWLDLLAVQGTLKSLLQHHRSSQNWSTSASSASVVGA